MNIHLNFIYQEQFYLRSHHKYCITIIDIYFSYINNKKRFIDYWKVNPLYKHPYHLSFLIK